MTIDLARLADPTFFAENRLPAHSDHRCFATSAEAASGVSSYEQCLDGVWKFRYSPTLSQAPDDFMTPGFEAADWDDIPVPAHLQLQGYGRPQYTNTQYP
ncbi:MAG: hypothetical protein LBV00_00770, partial [Propionibacteriaceae bacterium]|nr:hypothetical protein [Propionibacteriaceae bacterium]